MCSSDLYVDEAAVTYANLVAESDRATRAAEDAITGTKTRMKDQATRVKNLMLEAKKHNEVVQAHKAVAAGIAGQELPLRIIYQFQDRELILAETLAGRTAAAAPPRKEQPKSSGEGKENNPKRGE